MTSDRTVSRESARGQTTLDFTIGVVIFLTVLAGVFLFVPGTLQPFEEGGQEDLVTANRVADQLAEQSLGEPTTPHVLSDDCTVAFFNTSVTPPAECGYDGATLSERLGLGDRQFVNVTIREGGTDGSGTSEPLCWNGSELPGERLESADDCDSNTTTLAIGSTPVESQSTVTARRVVELDGQDVFLVVVLW
ncbi:DUF7287 family protein [Halapricum hydrolyticum]|uniref:Uncharacterized protein n=1 Tax=Halapricum hydrolyticum TaxID=2979991 RepID=A0AAE3I9Z8_9EURY|nr:hypothetical protein [Halapricum hydrolyticum]MCU4716611.1 hypothetical protein [Halapricum hydrolyticum]MCU4725784.1 hypothetical protein [Halapricum hydrolyticum]